MEARLTLDNGAIKRDCSNEKNSRINWFNEWCNQIIVSINLGHDWSCFNQFLSIVILFQGNHIVSILDTKGLVWLRLDNYCTFEFSKR